MIADLEENGPLVFVIDDDDDVRQIVSLVLREEGFDVVAAPNGAVALDRLFEGTLPAVIVLDLMMPVMSGWEFWDRTREVPDFRDIPIILLTASGLSQGVLGDAKVLPKPVGAEQLIAAVRAACETRAA